MVQTTRMLKAFSVLVLSMVLGTGLLVWLEPNTSFSATSLRMTSSSGGVKLHAEGVVGQPQPPTAEPHWTGVVVQVNHWLDTDTPASQAHFLIDVSGQPSGTQAWFSRQPIQGMGKMLVLAVELESTRSELTLRQEETLSQLLCRLQDQYQFRSEVFVGQSGSTVISQSSIQQLIDRAVSNTLE